MAHPAPELSPFGGIPTPPLSPRKRRRLLRDSEESDGEMSLEQYINSSDPYRSTTLPVPWPHPLKLEEIPDLRQQLNSFTAEIRQTLRTYGIPDTVPFIPYIATKPGYHGENLLLRVHLDGPDYAPPQIGRAKDELWAFLRRNGFANMHVEIVNTNLCFNPSLFAISSRHPTVLAFEQSKRQIMHILDRHFKDRWRVLCPFHIGRYEAKATPAVVVLVDPSTHANWSDLRISILSELSKYTEDRLEVEFLPGGLSFLQPVSFRCDMSSNGVPEMGYSVGIHGQKNAGTLGGYVTLRHNGTVHRGFLTNYHVVRPSNRPLSPDEFLADLDRMGASPSRPPAEILEIESLAQMDRDATAADIAEQIRKETDIIQDISTKAAEREMAGLRPLPGLQYGKEQAEALRREMRQKWDVIQQMPYKIGSVLATSGKANLRDKIMDWAFVRLTEESQRFFAPNKMFPVSASQQPSRYDPGLAYDVHPAGIELTEFGALEKDGFYLKRGRTTGITAGICNGALACCNWQARDRIRYDHNGNQFELSASTTEEFVIVNKKNHQRGSEQVSFAESGDSGSFVIDGRGKICGLLYTGTYGFYGPPGEEQEYASAGLAMSMPDLQDSIRLKVGASASLDLPQ